MKRLQRVLHVEDVPSIQVVTRIALEKLGGYEVLSCASGQAALAEVQAFAPDLILLDMMLPQMTGLELLVQLSALIDVGKTPVVLLTGHADEVAAPEELRRLGVRKLLHKPFNPLQLAAQLEDVWNAEHD